MAVANRYVGDDLEVQLLVAGGTHILTGDHTTFEVNWSVQSADVTAAKDGGIEEKPTLEDITASLTIFDTALGGTAIWSNLTPGVEGTIAFGPQGTATGKPKGLFRAFVQGKPISVPFNEGVTRSVEFRG